MPSPAENPIDTAVCERARLARDARFDGLFYTAVMTTGIYCRPVCPAPAPLRRNVRYFEHAAAAAAAGFRPCLRCRPERAPGAPAHRARSGLVGGALRLIEAGVLDHDSVAALAARVGISERHLRRLFVEELGAAPLDIAATRRLLFAKQLLAETSLPVTAIADASGYGSLRRFHAAFVASYGKSPRHLRGAEKSGADGALLTLRLPYRPPYDFAAMLAFLERRAVPGVEVVVDGVYRRSIVIAGVPSWFSVAAISGDDALALRMTAPAPASLHGIVAKVRRMFDVDADPAAVTRAFADDPLLAPLRGRWPGQRLPGAWHGFELGVRAVLGQQVSVAAARTLAARLVERFGERFEGAPDGLTATFPSPERLVEAELESIGLPRTRAGALRALARACANGDIAFDEDTRHDALAAKLVELPGIGAWTAQYIAMRALSQPDAFPAGDLVLRRVAGTDRSLTERALLERAEHWRPWRAYAVMLLWRQAGEAAPAVPPK